MFKCPLVVWWKSNKKLAADPEAAHGLFPSISSSHNCSNAAAPALHWADWCSRVITVPAPWVLVLVLTTPETGCKRNSIVSQYQGFKTSFYPLQEAVPLPSHLTTTGIFLMKFFGFILPAFLLLLFPLVTLTGTLTLL